MNMRRRAKKRKGAAMVEYAILVGAVALIGIVGMSVLGRKNSDIIGTLAVILPGVRSAEDVAVQHTSLVELTSDGTTYQAFDQHWVGNNRTDRLNLATGLGSSDSDSLFVIAG